MKILFYNIGGSTGISKSKWQYVTRCLRYVYAPQIVFNKIIEFIRTQNPDVVALTELDSGSIRSGFVNQPLNISESLDYGSYEYANTSGPYNWIRHVPLLRFAGSAIFSKKSIEYKRHYLSVGARRLVLEARLNDNLSLLSVHLSGFLGQKYKERQKQILELADLIMQIRKNCEVIVVGDFNTFRGPQELAPILRLENLSLVGTGGIPTFPTWKPRIAIDHFIVSSGIKVRNFEVIQNTETSELSDHLPILIEI